MIPIASNRIQEIKSPKDREHEIEQQREEQQNFAELIQSFPRMGLPVTIITGFLGRVKSTLINEILAKICKENTKVAVLVAEFGEIGINVKCNHIVIYQNQNINEQKNKNKHKCRLSILNNFELQDDLITLVYKVLERKEKIDYLIVETTGLADPLPIALTFLGTELRDLTRLDSIITVVDATNYS
jgi:G3E family GTPase